MELLTKYNSSGKYEIGMQFTTFEEMNQFVSAVLKKELERFGYELKFVKAKPGKESTKIEVI